MVSQQKIFFDFLQFCIGAVVEIPPSLKGADWNEIYAIAQKQCLLGILFDGIERLPADSGISKELLYKWMGQCGMLEKVNAQLNDAAVKVSNWFQKKGFRTCILKGQGNALMYPNPYSRTPGDIDIWVGKVEINGLSPLYALSRLMKRRAITTSSSHRIRVWRWKCIIGLSSSCASGITESFRNITR